MQEEDLSQRRYDFELVDIKNNIYSFKTINEIEYLIHFKPTPHLFGEISPYATEIFEFIIQVGKNPTDRKPTFDSIVSRTVCAIFEEFYLKSDLYITIYICESNDGRQDIRATKFHKWFQHFAPKDFNKYDSAFVDDSGEVYPVSLIVKDKNPNKTFIVLEFISIISGYNAEK